MRLGVFGGSFNPVHTGHLIAAECCREQARLDRVLFVPAAVPPHKPGSTLAPASDRVAMLQLATGGHDAFAVSTVEVDRDGVSYTVDTLAILAARHPGDRLVLLLGPDALAGLSTWRDPRGIAARAELVAVMRDGLDDPADILARGGLVELLGRDAADRLVETRVRMPAIGIRATDLREAVATKHSIRYRTPRAVERYILTSGLYAGG